MFDLTNPATIKSILSKFNLAPNKFLGQNFLIDQNVLNRIIEAADLRVGDNVLEIGPGLGTLTAALCGAGVNVVAIEKDNELIPVLEENLEECKENLRIINDDFLQVDFERISGTFKGQITNLSLQNNSSVILSLPASPVLGGSKGGIINEMVRQAHHDTLNIPKVNFAYKVISNIPYYITSPVIRKIFSFPILPTEIVFLVQREVAERIAAPAGEMSLISLYVQFHGKPSVVEIVKPESFLPAPKVESAILKIELCKKNNLFPEQEKELWHLAKIGFSSRRKTLANNLAAGFHRKNSEIKELLKKAGFGENARAQELSVSKWIELLAVMKKLK